MQSRPAILIGMAGGAFWAVCLLWVGIADPFGLTGGVTSVTVSMALGLLGPAVSLALLIGVRAANRFWRDDLIAGGQPDPDTATEVDQRVLTNTVEQTVLALCIWPAAAVFVATGLPVVLGAGFVLARGLFWWGYRAAPPLRAYGFAATFYPSLFAGLAVLWALLG